jgi:hypothetical protein
MFVASATSDGGFSSLDSACAAGAALLHYPHAGAMALISLDAGLAANFRYLDVVYPTDAGNRILVRADGVQLAATVNSLVLSGNTPSEPVLFQVMPDGGLAATTAAIANGGAASPASAAPTDPCNGYTSYSGSIGRGDAYSTTSYWSTGANMTCTPAISFYCLAFPP